MLHGQPRIPLAPTGAAAPPPTDSAFSTEAQRPSGIRFYRAREAFFLPYSLLQAMHWQGDKITLTYPGDEVIIEGQGLHALFVELGEFKVARIQEQSDQDGENPAPVHVTRIDRLPRE